MKILIADSHAEVQAALRLLVEQKDTVQVIGEVRDIVDLFRQIARTCPDILLLDVDLPELQIDRRRIRSTVVELVETLHCLCPSVRIILLSSQPTNEKASLSTKADAFICKGDPPETLLDLLDQLIA